jgi:hypothetical protein
MTPEQTEHDRHSQLEQLYTQNYGYILDLALTDKRLLPQDGERIAQSIAAHLDSYNGPLDPESFQKWIEGIIAPAVARLSRFYELRQQYYRSVLKGVWTVLRTAKDLSEYDDPARTARALADDVWLWVFQNLEALEAPGAAKLSTRLQQKGYWAGRAWRTARLRERDRTADLDVAFLGMDENGDICVESAQNREEAM